MKTSVCSVCVLVILVGMNEKWLRISTMTHVFRFVLVLPAVEWCRVMIGGVVSCDWCYSIVVLN